MKMFLLVGLVKSFRNFCLEVHFDPDLYILVPFSVVVSLHYGEANEKCIYPMYNVLCYNFRVTTVLSLFLILKFFK